MKRNSYLIIIALLIAAFSPIYAIPAKEQESKKELQAFVENYKPHSLKFIAAGKPNHLPNHVILGIWVTSKSEQTIATGRATALAFLNAYMDEIKTSKYVTDMYARIQSKEPAQFPEKLSLKNAAIRIAYWNDQVERPKAPFLSEIDFYDNTFRYYEADPKTQALKLVFEESYEKALENLKDLRKEND